MPSLGSSLATMVVLLSRASRISGVAGWAAGGVLLAAAAAGTALLLKRLRWGCPGRWQPHWIR